MKPCPTQDLGNVGCGTSQYSPSRAGPADFMDGHAMWAIQEQQELRGLYKDGIGTRSDTMLSNDQEEE